MEVKSVYTRHQLILLRIQANYRVKLRFEQANANKGVRTKYINSDLNNFLKPTIRSQGVKLNEAIGLKTTPIFRTSLGNSTTADRGKNETRTKLMKFHLSVRNTFNTMKQTTVSPDRSLTIANELSINK